MIIDCHGHYTTAPPQLMGYREAQQAHEQRLEAFCGDKQVGLSTLDTAVPPEEAILNVLRKGGLLS